MPRRKEPVPLTPDDEEEVEISEKMATVMDVLDRLGDKAEAVMLNSYDRETKKHAYLATIPVEQFSVQFVCEQYGGGDYIALMLGEKGQIIGRSVFQVDKRFKGKAWGDGPAALAATPAGMDPNAALILGQMKGFELVIQSQGVMMQGLLQALAGRKSDGGADPLDVGLRIAEIIKGAGGSGGGPSVKEMVTDMAETFREGIKFGQMTQVAPEKGFGDVIESLIPPVTKVLESYAAKGPAAAAALPAGAPAPKLKGPTVDLAKAPWLVHLRPFMQEIGQWAQAGWDPEAYVASMLARMPDNLVDEIEVAARDAGFVTNALAALPAQFHAYQAWLTKALEALKEQVQPESGGPQLHEEEEDDGDGS